MTATSPDAPAAPLPTFDALPLSADLRRAIDACGYTHPTPVQLAVFEPASRGRNLLVQARTGTGKTAAFGLPILDVLVKKSLPKVQALILTPTRELALQITREFEKLAQFRGTKLACIYGGAPMGKQIELLEGGAQVVVGTPGRVLDHLRRGTFDASNVKVFVLDEADEMLSMGFAKELHAIADKLPKDRQGLFFSATVPPDIERLAASQLKDPELIALSSDQIGALEIQHFVYVLRGGDKRAQLIRILEVEDPESAIVFCNTKDETERLAEALQRAGYEADWLNGDLEQGARERVMQATRDGKLRFLVATDVAARGIDISHLTHVINADFPETAEAYVHRTGRTGRAGKTGTAIAIVTPKDIGNLYILRLTYNIRPIERQLPTDGELKTRAEADLVAMFVDAFGDRKIDPADLSLARRLLSHPYAETIVAALVRDHLGVKISKEGDVASEAAAARRGKNPPALGAPKPPPPPPSAHRPPPARVEPRRDDAPRDDRRPRGRERSFDRGAHRGSERAPERSAERVREPLPPLPSVREEPMRPEGLAVAPIAPAPAPRREAPRDRRVPHKSFVTWEPPVDADDDKPILRGNAPENQASRAMERPTPIDAAPVQDDGDFAQIFINVGRRDGARPADFEQMLSEASLPAGDANSIRVRDRNTFVSVRKEHLARALEALAGKTIGGRSVKAEQARQRMS
jgi:ATP-dependent RNA helicase DeaD